MRRSSNHEHSRIDAKSKEKREEGRVEPEEEREEGVATKETFAEFERAAETRTSEEAVVERKLLEKEEIEREAEEEEESKSGESRQNRRVSFPGYGEREG
jgi:hypothetical protein